MKKVRINGDKNDIKYEVIDGLATSERSIVVFGEDILVSDGYHTMDELYDHRITLWITLCRILAQASFGASGGFNRSIWRTTLHSDGSNFDDWFLLGIGSKSGEQLTYHLPISLWDECSFATTRHQAPEFDGHTSADVMKRLKDL